MTQITTTYIDHMGDDLSVVNAARVSFGKKSHCTETKWVEMGDWSGDMPVVDDRDTKLIKYLAKHKHISPFGHAFASFHIKAPIFVARQLVKHKFLRWNEISRRYVSSDPEFYTPEQFRMVAVDKKQGSGEDATPELNAVFTDVFTEGQKAALADYQYCIGMGMSEELARSRLPLDLMTEWYWSGSLDAFADMCRLRCKEDTQYESRAVAEQISEMMSELYPVSWAALMKGEKQ